MSRARPLVPAHAYSLLFGGGLVLTGLIGLTGLLDTSTPHDLAHVASGAPGVLAWRRPAALARAYALALAVVYTVLALAGLEPVLHGLIALVGFAAFAASPQRRPASAA